MPKIKKELLLSKTEIKPICTIGLPWWQEKKLQKLSAEKLKEKGLAWVPKGSIQAQKDDAQSSGATKAKERRRFKKQLPSWRFAPNIKIIGHGIIHTLCLYLCGIHPLVCMVIPQLLILILGVDLYILEGHQIILLIDDQEPQYLFWLCILLWMNSYGRYFDIALSVKI